MNKKLLFLSLIILAQINLAQIKIFRNLTVEDGLAQSQVRSIYQDSKGYMWIGTSFGLSRWDGFEFKNYFTLDGLPDLQINTIYETSDNRLFVGTANGLAYFNENGFVTIPSKIKSSRIYITAIIEDSSKNIWVGSSRGLLKIVRDTLSVVEENGKLKKSYVAAIVKHNNNLVYVLGNNGIYTEKNKKLIRLVKDKVGITKRRVTVRADEKGNLYIPTRRGYYIYDGKKVEKKILYENDGFVVWDVLPETNQIMVSSNFGVIIQKGNEREIINRTNGLSPSGVSVICKDVNGIYFFGTFGEGIILYDGGKIISYTKQSGLSSERIFGITEGTDNEIYLATTTGGVNIVDKRKVKIISELDNLNSNFVLDVKSNNKGIIAAATGYGIAIIKNKKVIKQITRRDGLPRNTIGSIAFVDSNKFYVSHSKGISLIDISNLNKIKIKHFSKKDGLTDNSVNKVYYKNNVLYVGTDNGGLNILTKSKISHITAKEGLLNNKVLDIFKNDDGALFIGTQSGLNIIYPDTILYITTREGLSDNTIYTIGKDNYNRIYLTTNKGVNILTFNKLNFSISYLNSKNGLAGNECNAQGFFKDSKGRIWIGTMKGATCYDPSLDFKQNKPPVIHLAEVKLFDTVLKKRNKNEIIQLAYDQNYLKFEYIGINLAYPDLVKYQYRLTNIDPVWVNTSNRSVRYANLPDGKYNFEVRARNELGEWSKPVGVRFYIIAPVWKQWWFIISLSLIVILAIASFVYMRVKQTLELERLRIKLAADLHDNVGAGLTEISILSEVIAYTKDRNTSEVSKSLNLISDTARELVDSMSDIVWFVNPKKDSLYDLIIRLEESYREVLIQKGIAFESLNITDLEKISLPMEYRRHLFLIFKEAFHNCVKHSECKNMSLNAKVDGRKIKMILSDDGIGFDINKQKRGEGINNIYNRTKEIDGRIKIKSVVGKGTKIIYEGFIY